MIKKMMKRADDTLSRHVRTVSYEDEERKQAMRKRNSSQKDRRVRERNSKVFHLKE